MHPWNARFSYSKYHLRGKSCMTFECGDVCVCVWLLTLFNVIWHQIHRSISLHIFQMLDMFVTDKEYYNWHFGNIHNRNLLVCSRAPTDIFACVAVRQQLLKPRTPIKYIRKNQRLASDNENPIRIHANVQSERILHFKCETLPPTQYKTWFYSCDHTCALGYLYGDIPFDKL